MILRSPAVILILPCRCFNSVRADNVSIRADVDRVRADDDSGRSGVVGGAGGFVHEEEIEVGSGAGGSSNRVGQARGATLRRQAGMKNAGASASRHPASSRRCSIGALSRIRCDKSQLVSCDDGAPCAGAPSGAVLSDAIASARVMRPASTAAARIE